MKNILVTGGAGLIGSHIVDSLITKGYAVRILDCLEPQTHAKGKPAWIHPDAEFVRGDLTDRVTMRRALDGVDTVFHEAAYGGYMPDISKYVYVNSFGTAQMLEFIRDEKLPISKVIVASSQAVYREGAIKCTCTDAIVYPQMRDIAQLSTGDFESRCPRCGLVGKSIPTPEDAPLGGETVYALTKVDQEKLVLMWGKQTGIPTVALRYSCTYGPRQSIFNPYTGVIAIFATMILNDMAPVIYEDGAQTRDFSYVKDIARANLLVAESDMLDGRAVNVGSGVGTTICEVATTVATVLRSTIKGVASGEFRPGEMRHLTTDASLIRSIGYVPSVTLEEGIRRYITWIKTQGDVEEYFSKAAEILKSKKIVQRIRT